MKNSLKKFIKKTSKIQRIAIVAAIMVMISAVISVSYIAAKAASDAYGVYYTTSDGLWNYVWDKENDYIPTIVGYNGTDTNIVFPSQTYTHSENSETKVQFKAIALYTGDSTFFHNIDASAVTSVTIPDNITQIGSSVFYNCSSLTIVKLPDTLTKIGSSAFSSCTSLTAITLPESLVELGYGAFGRCTSLSQVNLPSKLRFIPGQAFSHTAIKSVVIPYGCTSIGASAFYNCQQLVNVVIPQSITKIDYSAFSDCTSLEKVIIPNSVTDLQSEVFYGCTSLKSVTLSKNLKEIPSSCFEYCSNLTEVKNIGNITSVFSYAFAGCTNLTSLNLPDTVTLIGYAAFRDTGINGSSLNLKNVDTIDSYAFEGITFSEPFTIPENVTSLSSHIFSNTSIPKLTIPSNVGSINSYAIRDAKIKELVWGTSIDIPGELMKNNTVIEKLTITKDINYIWEYSFFGCTNLKEVNTKKIISSVWMYAFQNCSSLTTFKADFIGEDIGDYAFKNCTSLTDISDSIYYVQIIWQEAFYNCSSLGKLTLGPYLQKLDANAFSYSGITELDATGFSGKSDSYVFSNCSKLTAVYNWNAPVVSYTYDTSTYIFCECTSLKTFSFGAKCNTFSSGNGFFYKCSALEDVYFLATNISSSINTSLMIQTPNTETIHYYKPASGTDYIYNYYKNYGTTQSFQLEEMELPDVTVKSISIDQGNITVGIGETVQLSATITYSNGSTAVATPENSYWATTHNDNYYGDVYISIDNTGKVKGIKKVSGVDVTVYAKESNQYYTIWIGVVESTVSTDSAEKMEIGSIYIDQIRIDNKDYVGNPFAMDSSNDGVSQQSYYSYIYVNVYPKTCTEQPVIEFLEGGDIFSATHNGYNTHTHYLAHQFTFTHLKDDAGNYKYGSVTMKISLGDLEPIIYSFDLEKSQKLPTGASFNDTRYQTTIEVGKSYDYIAFPAEWNGSADNPYMWYEVTYSIDNKDLADLSFETVENAAYDGNSGKWYTAYVATVTPKKAGTIKLKAHSGRYTYNYTELQINIVDKNEVQQNERPNESDDPNEIWATSITFPQSAISMAVGSTRTISPALTPANSNDELSFYSFNKSIASINPDTGEITANAVGETSIGVTTSSGLHTSMKVVVVEKEIATTAIKLNSSTLSLKIGSTSTLKATVTPTNATDILTWTSSNTNIVTVNNGVVIAAAKGSATITVTSGSCKATCTVNVADSATGIKLNYTKTTIKHGAKLQLNATIEPAGLTPKVTWTSSNPSIATVSSSGQVSAVGYGDVVITSTADNVQAKCTISVVPNLDFKILGASIRVSDPYGIRFGIHLGKTGDYGKVKIIEYGTVMMPTEKLGKNELSLSTSQVLKVQGKTIYSQTSSELVYTGVLINIPNSFFGTNVSGRGYLIYEDTAGVRHTIYTDVVSRSFKGVAQSAYNSYSKISNPNAAQKSILNKLKTILK